jgi:hypothetical protein
MTRIPHALPWLLGLLGLFCAPAAAVAQLGAPLPQSSSVIATGTTRSRSLADHLGDTVRAVNFGACVWDGAHDVAPCIQAAINAAAAAGGGDVIVPVGSYELASTLAIGTDLVRLVSSGGSDGLSWDDLTNQGTFPTVLTWTGASGAPMLTIMPPANQTAGQPLRGNGIRGILFNANSIAGYGAELLSVRAGEFRFGFRDAVTAGVLLDTVPLGEANDVQDNSFSIRGTNGDTDGDGIRFQATGNGGAWNGNVSLNIFDYARMRVRNGWCFNYTSASPNQSADNDYFRMASCQQVGNTAGSGGGIHFVGGSQQVFGYYVGAPVVQETGTTGNTFLMLDTGNGTPAPTINGGTPITWTDSADVTHNKPLAGQTVVSDASSEIPNWRGSPNYSLLPSLVVANGSGAHMQLWDSAIANGWGINLNGADFRINRLGGSGAINLGNGAPVNVTGALALTGTATLAGSSLATAATLASPPALGSTTPASVHATTLTANSAGLFADAAWDLANLAGRLTNQSLLITNGSNAHIELWSSDVATAGWGINIDSNKNLRINNISGGGAINLQAPVNITGTATHLGPVVLTPTTPASSSAACTVGQIAVDASYVYVCTATNAWKRAALASW